MIFGRNAYKAASRDTRNLRQQTMPRRSSAANDVAPDRHELIYRSRDLIRNNVLAQAILKTQTDFLCSNGFRPVTTAALDDAWIAWGRVCAVNGYSGWDDIYRDIIGAQVSDGEVIVSLPRVDGRLCVELIEADRIARRNTGTCIDGVEFAIGREVGYWIAPVVDGVYDMDNPVYMPRIINGEIATILLRRPDVMRPGQVHQVPLLTSCTQVLTDIDDLSDASLKRAIALSLVAAFIETDNPNAIAGTLGALGSANDMSDKENALESGEPAIIGDIESGAITTLPWGSKVTTLSPGGSQDVIELFKFFIRQLGAPLAMPLELLLKDFSDTSYSSGRLSYDMAYRARDRWNDGNANVFVRPLFERVVRDARIPDVNGEELEWLVQGVRFVGGYNVDIDPYKTAQAQGERIAVGVSTAELEAKSRGGSYYDIVVSRAEMLRIEKEVAEKYGLSAVELAGSGSNGGQLKEEQVNVDSD